MELENSREISGKEFEYYWNNDDLFSSFQENLNKDVMRIYGYKNYRQICKDTLFLSVNINNNILYITPSHQDGLAHLVLLEIAMVKQLNLHIQLIYPMKNWGKR